MECKVLGSIFSLHSGKYSVLFVQTLSLGSFSMSRTLEILFIINLFDLTLEEEEETEILCLKT